MVANAHQRPQATQALVEAGAPMWAQRLMLKLTGYFQPLNPRAPNRIWWADKADLPPAADWLGAIVVVPDQACLAVSDGTVWRRLDFGGPV